MLVNSKFIHLLFISGLYVFSHGSSEFHLINKLKSYEESKRYCREMYTDLATIHNFSEMNDLINLVSGSTSRAWIGLELADKRTWHWSLPGHTVAYTNWREGNPQDNDQDACVAVDENGKWFESDCKSKMSFVCHSDGGSHVFVADTKTWRDAQNHCRSLSTDLVSILSAEENAVVSNMSQNIWIGLFKDPWKWSDGSDSSFRYWSAFQPNYLEGQDCVTVIFKNSGKWNDLKCPGKRAFICQGAYKVPTTTLETTTQGATKVTYLSTHYSVTSESITVTFHFTLDKNSTNVSTTTVPTTVGVSAAPNTTKPVTLAPHSNTPDNLVLVQQNLTWVEAITYCRSNYIDLVHISTENVQMKVAEKAKNATTPHVWIGLKYTCHSKLWFWIRSSSGCYQNWAPQQGYEGNYNCGATGAIQATGRQQWVGLPQTEKLNFICYGCVG
ncbi:macrophage mannose receptor 1 [Periophthalmus magnuspinnatus]|uniref:macrophage mannose receptor 1 n=1 Tax=Periophthalmus magnuspinnatus TaxID=409849 RepID=UPI00243698BA|nr:macrophage mannose receptor 1 [Periophthalmus magnuspinnatus]